MDDLLYTLFVIAWIAYGIYKGVKKNNTPKKKITPVVSEPEVEKEKPAFGSAFESVFNEVFDLSDDKNDENSHPYIQETVKTEPQNQPVYENYAQKDVLDSYKGSDNIKSVFQANDALDFTDEESNKLFDNQMEEEGTEEQNIEFDLRQAVIHQVILERKY